MCYIFLGAGVKSKQLVVLVRESDFNFVATVDLEVIGINYIWWIIFVFIRYMKGVVVKS